MIITFGPDQSSPEQVCNRRSEDRTLHCFTSEQAKKSNRRFRASASAHHERANLGRIPVSEDRGHEGLPTWAWDVMGGACTHAMKCGGCEKGKETDRSCRSTERCAQQLRGHRRRSTKIARVREFKAGKGIQFRKALTTSSWNKAAFIL